MSTNAKIAKLNKDGSIDEIYVHWDGDLCLPILEKCYNSEIAAANLIELGALSALGARIAPSPGSSHTFDNPEDGVCIAYHRDRGEDLIIDHFTDLKQRNDNASQYFQFVYLWNGEHWKQIDGNHIEEVA